MLLCIFIFHPIQLIVDFYDIYITFGGLFFGFLGGIERYLIGREDATPVSLDELFCLEVVFYHDIHAWRTAASSGCFFKAAAKKMRPATAM